MCFEKGAYQMTVASADIANGPDAGEHIVTERFEYQVGLGGGMTGHSLIKSAPIARVRPRIFEGSSAKLSDEAILLAISDDVRQMLPNRIVLRSFGDEHPVSSD